MFWLNHWKWTTIKVMESRLEKGGEREGNPIR